MNWIITKIINWFGDGYVTDIARTIAKAVGGYLVIAQILPTAQLDTFIGVATSIIVGALTLLITLISSWKDKAGDIAKMPPLR